MRGCNRILTDGESMKMDLVSDRIANAYSLQEAM